MEIQVYSLYNIIAVKENYKQERNHEIKIRGHPVNIFISNKFVRIKEI